MKRWRRLLTQIVLASIGMGLLDITYEGGGSLTKSITPEEWRAQNHIPEDGTEFVIQDGFWKFGITQILPISRLRVLRKVADRHTMGLNLYGPNRLKGEFLVAGVHQETYELVPFKVIHDGEIPDEDSDAFFRWCDISREFEGSFKGQIVVLQQVDPSIPLADV